jgi:hypothetical protein
MNWYNTQMNWWMQPKQNKKNEKSEIFNQKINVLRKQWIGLSRHCLGYRSSGTFHFEFQWKVWSIRLRYKRITEFKISFLVINEGKDEFEIGGVIGCWAKKGEEDEKPKKESRGKFEGKFTFCSEKMIKWVYRRITTHKFEWMSEHNSDWNGFQSFKISQLILFTLRKHDQSTFKK